jgi:diguanylate cyclase (GGDEF)-like protein/PAS domain S-box-containing protein
MRIQAEANLSALIESTDDLIWSVDLEGRLIAYNQALRQNIRDNFGHEIKAGMEPADFLPPERAALWPPLYRRVLAEGSYRVEYPLADGRTLEMAFNPIMVEGNTTGISVFGKDITERKAAESALREADRKYRDIFDAALEGMFQTAPKGEPLTVNPALAKMLGYESPAEYLSLVRNVAHDVWANPNERALYLRQVKEQGTVLGFECQLKRKDGTTIWASLNTRRVCGDDGQLLYQEGFLIDITERKLAEEAQREGLDALKEAQAIGSLGSYVLNIPTGVWTSSDVMDEIFGIGKEYEHNVVGWAALVHPADRAMMTAYFVDEVLGRRKAFDKEYRIVRQSDGAERWVHGMGRLEFDAQGKPLKMRGIIKDITERRLAEIQRRDSEEHYRSTFEQAAVGIIHASFEGIILRSNAHFAEMVGYSAEELPGIDVQQITVPEDGPASRETLERVLSGGVPASVEKRYLRKDGSPTWVKLTISIQRDGEGRALYCTGLVEDINARKAAEERLAAAAEALRLGEERYRTVFDTSPNAIVVSRLSDGVVIDANQTYLEAAGYVRDQAIGRTTLELGIWANAADRQRLIDSLLRNNECRDMDFQSIRRNGEPFWMRISASLIEIAGDKCIVAFAQDISEARAAEERLAAAAEALRLGEERYRTVFDTSPTSILVGRLSDGVIIDANRTFLDWTKYERNEVVGHTTLELGIWANAADRQKLVEALLRNSVCRDMEVQSTRRNGELFWMRLSASLIEIRGCPCIVAFAQDITEARAAGERLAAAASALRLSEERYRTVFQTCPDAVSITRVRDGVVLDANQAFLDSAGFEHNEVVGRTLQDLAIWVNESDRLKLIDAVDNHGSVQDLEVLSRRKNGEIFWIRLSASLIEIEGVQCRLTFAKEISDVKAAEESLASATEALLASEERYRTVFHTSLDCITLSHLGDGRYIDVNKAFLDLIGIEPEEIVGRTSTDLGIWAHPETRTEIAQILRRDSSIRDFQTQFVKKDGERIWVLISASVIEIGGLSCVVSVVRDISGAKAAESTIHSLAFYDPLTGLPNRRLLFDRLQQTLFSADRSGQSKALLLVDLDNLKTLNDTLGHHMGDLLLKEVARRIATCAHEADTVGRLGGDEFVVILDDLSEVAEEAATQAKAAGQEILTAISQPYLLENRECLTAASMGVTVFGDRENSPDNILQQADIALHLAKANGRNTLRFFSPALQAVVNAQALLEKDLRLAIKTKQFMLYYQPQVERGRLTGAEALIRWRHPSRGIVSPDEFIPIAEESRLILPMGDWVLETACKQIASWAGRHETERLTIAVNISALQFRQPEFVERVLAALDRTGANPKCLKLELTESMLVENIEDVIAKMAELKSHGLSFSLDDFGTGYSSLAYLKRLPLDQLKIDRSFVRDMLVDLTSGAIAQTIISLGRAMELSVVAEGVESEEQRGFLAGLGCHCFQGDLFSPPLPPEEFEAFL